MYLELERYDCVQPDRLSIKVHVQINSVYRCRIRVLSNFKKKSKQIINKDIQICTGVGTPAFY